MLEKSKSLAPNITRKKSMALKSLKDNKEIRILQSYKENCKVVLNVFTYKEKITSVLEPGVYVIVRSRDSVVGIATHYGLDDQGVGVRAPGG
jgi:hypothetical protein